MAKCNRCQEKAAMNSLCKSHFTSYFEDKVKTTISRYRLLRKKDKVIVAVSGGKDSLSVLYILKKLGYDVCGLAIDEGIAGYRDSTLITLKKFCKKNNVKLKIVSFKGEYKKTLDEILKDRSLHPCSICGVFRRYLLNKHSKGYDVIATGHNLDDEAQSVIMNLLKNNIAALERSGPISGKAKVKGLTKRVKPLCGCLEKEVMAYSFINGLTTDFSECPHVPHSFRLRVRDMLNEIENEKKGTKSNITSWMIKRKGHCTTLITNECKVCGEATSGDICKSCETVRRLCL